MKRIKNFLKKDIPYSKGINIYTHFAKQILKYLKKSEESCRYCTNVSNYIKWTCSNNPKETDWNGKINL